MNIDPEKFRAPYLPPHKIQEKVDEFCATYWPGHTIPVDICKIAEFKLNLEIRPKKNLRSYVSIEALMLGNRVLIVDEDEWFNDYFQNRVKFSFAHEIGHLVLHYNDYEKFGINSIEDWNEFFSKIPDKEYKLIEYQANEFAGRLLVPSNLLECELLKYAEQIKQVRDIGNIDPGSLSSYLAPHICSVFDVSDQVIENRIDREDLITKIMGRL